MNSKNILASKIAMPFIALFCCLLWSSAFPSLKVLYSLVNPTSSLDLILQAGIRFTLAGLILLTYSFFSKRKRTPHETLSEEFKAILIKKDNLSVILILSAVMTFVPYACYYIGLSNTTAVKSAILVSSEIFFLAILSHYFIKGDKITAKKMMGLVFGFIGLIFANFQTVGAIDFSFKLNGEGLLLLCFLLFSIGNTIIKRKSGKIDIMVTIGWEMLIGGALLFIVGITSGAKIPPFSPSIMMLTIYLALMSSVVFTIWSLMLQYHKPSSMTIFKFSIPIFGSILSILFLSEEVFTLELLIALALVSVGIIAVNLKPKKNRSQSDDSKTVIEN